MAPGASAFAQQAECFELFITKAVYGGKDFEPLAELIAGSEIDERVASDRVQLIGLSQQC